MKILIVSDTHGYNGNFYKVIEKESDIDYLFHAGDLCGSEDEIRFSVKCPVVMVAGNNDYSFSLSKELDFELNGFRFFLTHGYREHVYFGTDRLVYKAAEKGANVVIFGHTHVPVIQYDEDYDMWIINPGSLTYPRQSCRQPSYIVLEIIDDELKFELRYI